MIRAVTCPSDHQEFREKGGVRARISDEDDKWTFADSVIQGVHDGSGMKYYDCIWPLYSAVKNLAETNINVIRRYRYASEIVNRVDVGVSTDERNDAGERGESMKLTGSMNQSKRELGSDDLWMNCHGRSGKRHGRGGNWHGRGNSFGRKSKRGQ
jgi:hypothetical protein